MVHGQVAALAAAVLAGPAVPGEHCTPGDLAAMRIAGDLHVGHEADHDRPRHGEALGVQAPVRVLEDLRSFLQHEHSRSPHRADVDRLEGRVQDEHPAA